MSMNQSAKRSKSASPVDATTEATTEATPEDMVGIIMTDNDQAGNIMTVINLNAPRSLLETLVSKKGELRSSLCAPTLGAEWLNVDIEDEQDGLVFLYCCWDMAGGELPVKQMLDLGVSSAEMKQVVQQTTLNAAAYMVHVRSPW